jgi:hypothetical protein
MAEELRGPFEKFVDSPYYFIYVFEKRVEPCKKYIACQGRHFEKQTVLAPPQSSLRYVTSIWNIFETVFNKIPRKQCCTPLHKVIYVLLSNCVGSDCGVVISSFNGEFLSSVSLHHRSSVSIVTVLWAG